MLREIVEMELSEEQIQGLAHGELRPVEVIEVRGGEGEYKL